LKFSSLLILDQAVVIGEQCDQVPTVSQGKNQLLCVLGKIWAQRMA